ncbi:WD40/YVTN repeat-like-containing domain [Phytophthora cactorum]|nr:WD40/YVTN repeat-like-containing domain [Phytophthora cactorum]
MELLAAELVETFHLCCNAMQYNDSTADAAAQWTRRIHVAFYGATSTRGSNKFLVLESTLTQVFTHLVSGESAHLFWKFVVQVLLVLAQEPIVVQSTAPIVNSPKPRTLTGKKSFKKCQPNTPLAFLVVNALRRITSGDASSEQMTLCRLEGRNNKELLHFCTKGLGNTSYIDQKLLVELLGLFQINDIEPDLVRNAMEHLLASKSHAALIKLCETFSEVDWPFDTIVMRMVQTKDWTSAELLVRTFEEDDGTGREKFWGGLNVRDGLMRLIETQRWQLALTFVGHDTTLQKVLLDHMVAAGELAHTAHLIKIMVTAGFEPDIPLMIQNYPDSSEIGQTWSQRGIEDGNFYSLPEEVQSIVLCNSEDTVRDAMEHFFGSINYENGLDVKADGKQVVGLDVEWKPITSRSKAMTPVASILQIASSDRVFVVDLLALHVSWAVVVKLFADTLLHLTFPERGVFTTVEPFLDVSFGTCRMDVEMFMTRPLFFGAAAEHIGAAIGWQFIAMCSPCPGQTNGQVLDQGPDHSHAGAPQEDADTRDFIAVNSICIFINGRPKWRYQVLSRSNGMCSLCESETPSVVCIEANCKLDMAQFARLCGVGRRRVRLTTASECRRVFGFTPGTVAPFGHKPWTPKSEEESTQPVQIEVYADSRLQDPQYLAAGSGSPDKVIWIESKAFFALTSINLLDDITIPRDYFMFSFADFNRCGQVQRRHREGAKPLEYKFLADSMVTQVGRWLRTIGVDVVAWNPDDAKATRSKDPKSVMLAYAARDDRIVLTRDTGLPSRRDAGACFVLSDDECYKQFREVKLQFGLLDQVNTRSSRCARCNSNAFSPIDAVFAPASANRLAIRGALSLQIVQRYSTVDEVQTLVWSEDSQLVLTASLKRAVVQLWSVQDASWTCKISEGVAGLVHARWTPDARHVVTVSDFQLHATVWSLEDPTARCSIRSPKLAADGLSFSSNGDFLAVAERHDCKDFIGVYSCESWELTTHFSIDSYDCVEIVVARRRVRGVIKHDGFYSY